jgi:hypothetical protein
MLGGYTGTDPLKELKFSFGPDAGFEGQTGDIGLVQVSAAVEEGERACLPCGVPPCVELQTLVQTERGGVFWRFIGGSAPQELRCGVAVGLHDLVGEVLDYVVVQLIEGGFYSP